MNIYLALFCYFLGVLLTVPFPALLKFDDVEVIFIYTSQNVISARYERNF
jgi:hypothetical protein